jgi:hypothetical protein
MVKEEEAMIDEDGHQMNGWSVQTRQKRAFFDNFRCTFLQTMV